MVEQVMEKVRSKDGTLIAYQRSGEGPPLILVHGTLGLASRWRSIIPELAKHFTVYAMDRRGRGESGDTNSYSLHHEAEDIVTLVESIGEKVNLLGHSYGGLCTLEATLLTENIHRLIVYECPPLKNPIPAGAVENLQALLDAGKQEDVVITFLRDIVSMPLHELKGFQASPVFPERVAIAHTIPREIRAVNLYQVQPERFKHMNVPTLLLLGGDSPQMFKQTVETWHHAVPNTRIKILKGQQHIAMDTAPDLFVREVTSFLKQVYTS